MKFLDSNTEYSEDEFYNELSGRFYSLGKTSLTDGGNSVVVAALAYAASQKMAYTHALWFTVISLADANKALCEKLNSVLDSHAKELS